MNIEKTKKTVSDALKAMNKSYMRDVFDEWTLISIQDSKAEILAYEGPRADDFKEEFAEDISSLSAKLVTGDYHLGDFEFTHEGDGQMYDAFVVAGDGIYLALNNIQKSMEQITSDQLWRTAQGSFVQLCDSFRLDPVSL